jgi:hypothetical protein
MNKYNISIYIYTYEYHGVQWVDHLIARRIEFKMSSSVFLFCFIRSLFVYNIVSIMFLLFFKIIIIIYYMIIIFYYLCKKHAFLSFIHFFFKKPFDAQHGSFSIFAFC